MPVPFVDLKAQYRAIRTEIDAAIQDVVTNTAFALGPAVERFETEFAEFLDVRHVVGTSNGTTAIQLSLLAMDIGPGHEVIVPAHTFIATAEAVSHVGARPILVDVLDDTGNMDPDRLEAAITPRTRAIIPVHLYGYPADLDRIQQVAESRGIPVIEDACQAHGARYGGRRVGSFGTLSCFSFYPGKNLGAYGEGGAVATDDADLAARIRRLRDHGQSRRYHHAEIGYNARLEGIQGAVLAVKLRYLDRWNESRRKHADYYSARLAEAGVRIPTVGDQCEPVIHLYVIRLENRDALKSHLEGRGIQVGLHYPIPIHLQPAYGQLGHGDGDFPRSEAWARECLSLPMYPELTKDLLDEVIEGVRTFGLVAVPQSNKG